MFFCEEKRADVKDKNPELKITQIAKLLAEQWKSLTDENKKVYIDRAEEDKARYMKEKAKH